MVNPPPEPTFIILYTYIYIYIYTWKTIKTIFSVRTGLDIFFVRYVFFPNTAMSGCKPSTYRSIVFLNSWICRNDSDSMSVSSRDSIWGSMLTFAYCLFSTWCWKNTGILWVHPNLVGNMEVFVARFGCPITTPNLLHFGLKFLFWKLSEDVRTRCCQRIWTTLHNQKPKYAIQQKKRPLRVKPTGKIVHTVFHVLLYLTCLFPHLRWIWPGGQACDHASEAGDELRLHIYVGPQRQVLPHMAPASAAQPPFLGAMVLGKWTWGDFPTIIGGYGDNDEQIELNTMG